MKLFLWPAKRHRNERIRAAVQHSAGMSAVGRIVCVSMYIIKYVAVVTILCMYTNDKDEKREEKGQAIVVESLDKGTVIHLYNARARTQDLEMQPNPCFLNAFTSLGPGSCSIKQSNRKPALPPSLTISRFDNQS